jgi:hypothetical protein
VNDTATLGEGLAARIGDGPGRSRRMITDPRPGNADLEADGWLTTVLRPAGTLDQPALDRLSEALARLAATSDMVIVDLTATHVAAPRALARSLQAPALELRQPGRCLLLVGAPPDLLAELDRAAVRVASLAADTPPLPGDASPRSYRQGPGTPR